MRRSREQRRDDELLGSALMGFVLNKFVDCSDEEEAKIMWLIAGMEAYAATVDEVADIRGRIKRLLIDQWVRFDHRPPPPARPRSETEPDDDIPF
jgi:hypothetical protein